MCRINLLSFKINIFHFLSIKLKYFLYATSYEGQGLHHKLYERISVSYLYCESSNAIKYWRAQHSDIQLFISPSICFTYLCSGGAYKPAKGCIMTHYNLEVYILVHIVYISIYAIYYIFICSVYICLYKYICKFRGGNKPDCLEN